MKVSVRQYAALVHFRTLTRMGRRHYCAIANQPSNDN